MIGDKSVLAIIPARGGSKGVPRKNIKNLAGKPLIAWTIEAAKNSRYIDRLILSSDDPEIIMVARAWGCDVPFVRPSELARDDTPGIEPVLHALTILPDYDYVLLLQPTSPMRTVEDMDGALALCIGKGAKACVSVTEPDKSPYWMYKLDEVGRMLPLLDSGEIFSRRQDLPKVYSVNGAVYVADCTWLKMSRSFLTSETVAFEMPKGRAMDIDDVIDFAVAELFLKDGQYE
jgi:CMP-N,N'-diacetyllegionaminic acid synthase